MLGDNLGMGLIYVFIVALLGALYFVQQRMVAARAAVSPTMSPGQQKLMQYLPVAFAVFQVFFLLGLVIYYMAQAVLRIGQQAYITRAFYGHEEALGRQAQRAGEQARELAKQDSDGKPGGGGIFSQAKRDLAAARDTGKEPKAAKAASNGSTGARSTPPPTSRTANKRTTAPKGRPTPSGKGPSGRPQRASTSGRPGGPRSKGDGKRGK
jgi:YidC/Oxa1 family membrane protein insertase